MVVEQSVSDLLRTARIEVAPANYVIIGLSPHEWSRLLENPELSPRSDTPFMVFRDAREVTLLVEENDWERIRFALPNARIESGYRLVTLDVVLPWNVVGFLARLTEILATAQISVGVLSSISRDHLLLKQEDLGRALRVLSGHVGEFC